jgi:hypothetical protein
MLDLSETIIPKSDQLNADDLVAGPLTIKITKVVKADRDGVKAFDLSYEGDNNRPWKPCKTMRRVILQAWGTDGTKFVGRRITVFRDESVKWAGAAVGGIRISHMSDLVGPLTTSLTITRGQKRPYVVKPLAKQEPVVEKFKITDEDFTAWTARMDAAKTPEDLEHVGTDLRAVAGRYDTESRNKLVLYFKDRKAHLSEADPLDEIITE